jgi:hypothetical protein
MAEFLKKAVFTGATLAPFAGLVYPLTLIAIAVCINVAWVPETYKNNLAA